MNKSTIALIAVLALAIAAVPFAFAANGPQRGGRGGFGHGPGHGFGMGFLERLDHLKQELELTDDQVTQLREIAKSVRDENAQYRDEMRSNMHEIATILLADPNATAQAQAILNQQAAVEQKLKTNMLQGFSRGLNVLTAEQRSKLAEMLARRHAGI